MSTPVTSKGQYLSGLENRRKAEWCLFQTGYFGYDLKHGTGHGIDEYYVETSGSEFLDVAKRCHDYIKDQKMGYDNTFNKPIPYPNGFNVIDCSSYVTWVLYEYGYTELQGPQKLSGWFANKSTMEKMGWTVLPATQAQAGDIVARDGHVEIYAGDGNFYNAGSTNAIQSDISHNGTSHLSEFEIAVRVTPPS